MKRNDLLNRMARLARRYGFEFSKPQSSDFQSLRHHRYPRTCFPGDPVALENRRIQTAVLDGSGSETPLSLLEDWHYAKPYLGRHEGRTFWCGELPGGCTWRASASRPTTTGVPHRIGEVHIARGDADAAECVLADLLPDLRAEFGSGRPEVREPGVLLANLGR